MRVLIADDEAGVRDYVARAVALLGWQNKVVGDGLAAAQALREGRFDLLVSDIVMPGMDGITLALMARKQRPDMAILLITGFAAQRQRAVGLEALIDGVLEKPFSLDELTARLLQCVGLPPDQTEAVRTDA